ncbi:putative RNA-directed DNA polymerase [Helianthus annuus]|nr:putative RNA-directed DNA polymerase [Helianthus annuus]
MASPSDSTTTNVPHLYPIKLSATNYLVWRNHMRLLVAHHSLTAYIDGSSSSPSETVSADNKTIANPEFASWTANDQKAALLLLSSLTEEAAAEVLGLNSARQIWTALEAAYNNASVERVQSLRDSLRSLTKGTTFVTVFARKFKNICEQLAAIGHPVADIDKLHWFLCGLGPSYESLHGAPPVAFHAQNNRRDTGTGRGRGSSARGSYSRGSYTGNNRGRGNNRRPPHCQLCRTNGHYASSCPSLHTYASQASPVDDSLAKAFHAQCHVNHDNPDWTSDSGSTYHMTSKQECLHHSTPYIGNDTVTFGNGSENKTGTR